jgi:molecular chaperone HscB
MRSCVFCKTEFAATDAGHVCPKCGAPQPVAPGDDYFSLLGVARGFRQDKDALERKFYAISRELHPDRFAAGADSKWKTISVERMSAGNRAYQTLTHCRKLREYLLELEGLVEPGAKPAEAKTQIPAELAEEWFELQDAVMEEPEQAEEKLAAFEAELKTRAATLYEKIEALEGAYDLERTSEGRKDALRRIEKLALDGQYLRSMERDLQKLKSRLAL